MTADLALQCSEEQHIMNAQAKDTSLSSYHEKSDKNEMGCQ